MPLNCNDPDDFRTILGVWVPRTVLRDDAERRLVVRIHRSTGGKRANTSLVDAQGSIVAELHDDYAANVECHRVLWNVARGAAKMMGAFEPPPLKEPVACPASAPCPPARPCPTCPLPAPPTRTLTPTPTPYQSFIGFGAFVGSGIYSDLGFGPYLLLGYVPSRRLPYLHVEFEAGWTSQMSPSSMTSESIRMFSMPLVSSACLVHGIVRFCGGLATTIFYSNQSPAYDELHLIFGGNFRVATELFAHGPFSIRADVFGRIAFAQRRFGQTTVPLDDPIPFAAGMALIGAWLFD